jgi:hypothetical protein
LGPGSKVVVGRDQHENHRLGNELREGDYAMEISGQPGPLTLIRGEVAEGDLTTAASITARYGKSGGRSVTTVLCRQVGNGSMKRIHVEPVDRHKIRSLMLGGGTENGGRKTRPTHEDHVGASGPST